MNCKQQALEIFDELDSMLDWTDDDSFEGTDSMIDCLIIKHQYESLKEKYTGIKPKFPKKGESNE